ncbi:MAG: S-layer homology domain-containing protein [Clostridiales bacterium]|nr:S-layer homology domain-containing protein [Clostridiales bacterium]
MKKYLTILTATVLTIALLSSQTVPAAEENALTIKGPGVKNEVSFTRSQLEGLKKDSLTASYSTVNSYPTAKIIRAQGVRLAALLDKAGLMPGALWLKVTADDGASASFTIQELLEDSRYYYPNILSNSDKDAKKAETILALQRGEGEKGKLTREDPVLIFGQRWTSEQTNPGFIRSISLIEVNTSDPGNWPAPQANLASGAISPDSQLVLSGASGYNKIYYTLDGTAPGLKSPIYNTSNWNPNLAITINKTTTVKAMIVGSGKYNSSVATFTYTVGGKITFSDLGAYPWAQTAIENLAGRNIISGTGGGKFSPGANLTRGQFAKIMTLALGYTVPATVSKTDFSDVPARAWYAPYVQKASEANLMQGDGKKFRPDDNVSKQEMIAVVVRAMGNRAAAEKLTGAGLTNYTGLDKLAPWARGYLEQAEKDGLLEKGHVVKINNGKYSFEGTAPANRAEAAVTVYNMLQKL